MGYKLNDPKVLSAIDYIVKDVDKKFDECLVDRFLEFIEKDLNSSECWDPESLAVVNRLKNFIDYKAFVMLNQTRAFKLVLSVLKPKQLREKGFLHILPLLNSVWDSLGTIIINNNLSAVTILLSIFEQLLNFVQGFEWLINKKIDSPVEVKHKKETFKIEDVISFVKLYVLTSNNYHTRNKAEKLFENLIITSLNNNLPSSHVQLLRIKQTIRELMLQGSFPMTCIMVNVFKNLSKNNIERSTLFERYEWLEIVQESFAVLIEQPVPNLSFFKCLALSNSSKNFTSSLEKLKSKDNLRGIIVYISNSHSKDNEYSQLLLTYLLYPLLTSCNGEDTQVLIKKLLATREEKDFIDKNMNSMVESLCLTQLINVFDYTSSSNAHVNKHLTSRSLLLIVNTLTNYIKCHLYSVNHYKRVMDSCNALEKLIVFYSNSSSCYPYPWISGDKYQLLESTFEILEYVLSENDIKLKPKILNLMGTFHFCQVRASVGICQATHKMSVYWRKMVELAFKYEDHDIMNEFIEYFMHTSIYCLECDDERYVELIWNHMYSKAKDTDHAYLLGGLAGALVEIDVVVEARILEKFGLRRHHNIPLLLGDLLIEQASKISLVELIILALDYSPFEGNDEPLVTYGYVCRLDSPTLPTTVKKGLDRLALGLCAAIKGEASEVLRLKALKYIKDLVGEILTNSDNASYILARLVRTGVIETVYEVVTGSLYPSSMYSIARTILDITKVCVIVELPDAKQQLLDQLVSKEECINEEQSKKRTLRIEPIIELYTSKSNHSRKVEDSSTQVDDSIAPYSLVDDILNFELISDGITDCY